MKKTDKTKEEQIEQPKETIVETEILLENEGKVGGILKQSRLRQGKKLVEIAQCLCIRKAYLEAIEESHYDSIPENPYGLGFIRSYAEYLGENSSVIVRMYKDETAAKFGDNKMHVLEPQVEATVPNRKYLLLSLLGIIAVYFLWLGYNKYNNAVLVPAENTTAVEESATDSNAEYPLVVEDYAPAEEVVESEEVSAEEETSPSEAETEEVINVAPLIEKNNEQVVVNEGNFVEEKTVSAEPAPKKEDTKKVSDNGIPAEVFAQPAAGKSNIVIHVKKETWIEVKNNQKLYLSKVLPAGTVYALPEAEGLIFSAGRVEGVDVYVAGKLVDIIKPNKKTNIALDDVLKTTAH